PLLRRCPLRGDPPAAHDVAGLHLEDVGEVGTQRDLKLKSYPLHAVVSDVDILVHAAADRSAENKAQRALRDDAIHGGDPSIGEINARSVVSDGATIKQVPGFAVGEDGPTADDARVEEIKPLLAWPADLPVRFAYQHCLALVDGDLVRADLNLEWH